MIYLDNAASTHKKPKSVYTAMYDYMKYHSSNSGRSGHKLSVYTDDMIYECRECIARLFGIDNPALIAFTPNATAALNYAVHGFVNSGDDVVIGGMEHNAVLRPIIASGAKISIAPADKFGVVSDKSVESKINNNTKLIIINHTSNIIGAVSDINKIGKVAKKYNIPLLVDAAQSAGVMDIDVERDNIAMLAFAGHKLLYGPTGTGGLFVRDGITLSPIIQGGTGSLSESELQPAFMPDLLESGTLNCVGIAGLLQGVKYVIKSGTDMLYDYEYKLTCLLRERLLSLKNVTVYGDRNCIGIVGFNIKDTDSVTVSNILSREFNIASRGGLHCAVSAHRSIGTENSGLVRLSVSGFTKKSEIQKAYKAVKAISEGGDKYY